VGLTFVPLGLSTVGLIWALLHLTSQPGNALRLVVTTGTIFSLSLLVAYVGMWGWGRRVVVCEHGLVDIGWFGYQAVLWTEVEAVWEAPEFYAVSRWRVARGCRLVLFLAGGREVEFNTALDGTLGLARRLQEEVARVRFPGAVQALQAGKAVRCGAVAVSADAVIYDGGRLPHEDLLRVDVNDGTYFALYSRALRGLWASVHLEKVENLGLLKRLLEWLQGPR
jgi:hypothetical protein